MDQSERGNEGDEKDRRSRKRTKSYNEEQRGKEQPNKRTTKSQSPVKQYSDIRQVGRDLAAVADEVEGSLPDSGCPPGGAAWGAPSASSNADFLSPPTGLRRTGLPPPPQKSAARQREADQMRASNARNLQRRGRLNFPNYPRQAYLLPPAGANPFDSPPDTPPPPPGNNFGNPAVPPFLPPRPLNLPRNPQPALQQAPPLVRPRQPAPRQRLSSPRSRLPAPGQKAMPRRRQGASRRIDFAEHGGRHVRDICEDLVSMKVTGVEGQASAKGRLFDQGGPSSLQSRGSSERDILQIDPSPKKGAAANIPELSYSYKSKQGPPCELHPNRRDEDCDADCYGSVVSDKQETKKSRSIMSYRKQPRKMKKGEDGEEEDVYLPTQYTTMRERRDDYGSDDENQGGANMAV